MKKPLVILGFILFIGLMSTWLKRPANQNGENNSATTDATTTNTDEAFQPVDQKAGETAGLYEDGKKKRTKEEKGKKVSMHKPGKSSLAGIPGPAVSFAIRSPKKAKADDCIKVEVAITDVDGRSSLRRVQTPVLVGASSGDLFTDSKCEKYAENESVHMIPARAPATVVYLKTKDAGEITVGASNPNGEDLPLSSTVQSINVSE